MSQVTCGVFHCGASCGMWVGLVALWHMGSSSPIRVQTHILWNCKADSQPLDHQEVPLPSLIFDILTIMSWSVTLLVDLFRTQFFLNLDVCFLFLLRDISIFYIFKCISLPLLCVFSFWDSTYNVNDSKLSIILFIQFLFQVSFSHFYYSVFQLTDLFLCII